MPKIRHIIAVIAAATLTLSTAASAAGFAIWRGGRNFAYWGPHGLHVGHWHPGIAGWYPGKLGGWYPGKFGGWYPGKYAGAGVYYGCVGCSYGYYGDYYDHYHDNDDLLWYGLGVATTVLAQRSRPAVATASTPLPARHIELSADALFAFDKATLMPGGKEKLDQLVHDLGDVSYDTIVVEGYTDPLGSDAYNQRLSERRATTVARYLISHGAHARTLRAEGRGETELRVTPADCSGARGRLALIACYQPNRRVEVTVTGAMLR